MSAKCQLETFRSETQFRLFDHPIRAHEDRRRDRYAECFGAVQVDNEFEHRGLFDW
jgi:hypothetical protein